VGLGGSASYANGVFTVKGAGAGINYSADAYHFVYQALSGDGSISARVVSATGASPQVGVTIRETLDSAATNAFVNDLNQSGIQSVYLVDRTSSGAGEVAIAAVGATLPYWIRVVRTGSTFTGYTSSDGVNWVSLGSSQAISMASTVYLGLGVSSQDVTSLTTAVFDNVSFSSIATPAPVISNVSATTGAVGSQVVISGTGFGTTQGTSQVFLAGVPVTINSWSATSITITIPSGGVTGPLVVSVAPGMDDSNPIVFTVTTKPLPAGWLDQDVGSVGKAGSATYLNGVFTVKAAGGGLANAADGFHFVYQTLNGDGALVARMVTVQGSPYAQGGVLIRETLDASATNMFVAAGNSSGSILLGGFDRLTTGAGEGSLSGGYFAALPSWIKVVRSAFVFSVYTSLDGVNWSEMGLEQPISMAQTVYIGMGVNSGDPATLATATFDNVSLSSSTATSPIITNLSATTGPVGSQVVVSGSGFGATQGSSTVSINDVTAAVSSWSSGSITVSVPSGATSGPLVVTLAPGMDASNPVTFTVVAGALPTGWLDQDIGAVGVAGSASYASGVFTIHGAGYGVGNTADAFHFVYQPLSSNGTIIAKVKTQGANTQAGVMIRPTFDPSSTNVFT
jgi:regulation of enolase protein 1 (concanavalin A-like superfamily)